MVVEGYDEAIHLFSRLFISKSWRLNFEDWVLEGLENGVLELIFDILFPHLGYSIFALSFIVIKLLIIVSSYACFLPSLLVILNGLCFTFDKNSWTHKHVSLEIKWYKVNFFVDKVQNNWMLLYYIQTLLLIFFNLTKMINSISFTSIDKNSNVAIEHVSSVDQPLIYYQMIYEFNSIKFHTN